MIFLSPEAEIMEVKDPNALITTSATQIRLAGEVLADKNVGDDVKAQTIGIIKKIFADSSKNVLSKLELESLLDEAALLFTRPKSFDKEFVYEYGTSLVDFIGRYDYLDLRLIDQFESVLFELKDRDEQLTDKLVEHLWCGLINKGIFHAEFLKNIMGLLGKVVERLALDWVDGAVSASDLDYHLKVSSECPEFFQATSSVFYEILLKRQGSVFVLEKIAEFVKLVISRCENERKDAFRLYPPGYRRLVSLLLINPEIYSKTEGYQRVTAKPVLKLLSENYLKNRREALMLLSHYPLWLEKFKLYVDEGSGTGNGLVNS